MDDADYHLHPELMSHKLKDGVLPNFYPPQVSDALISTPRSSRPDEQIIIETIPNEYLEFKTGIITPPQGKVNDRY